MLGCIAQNPFEVSLKSFYNFNYLLQRDFQYQIIFTLLV